MATRSTIAVETIDGRVQQVYCHWDGYIDHNGRILLEHYSDWSKAIALVAIGDISSLREEVGQPHDFDERYDDADERSKWTNYYGRDRGETGCGTKTWADFEDYKAEHQYEEFEYIMRNTGEWFVSSYGGAYMPLADVYAEELRSQMEEEETD